MRFNTSLLRSAVLSFFSHCFSNYFLQSLCIVVIIKIIYITANRNVPIKQQSGSSDGLLLMGFLLKVMTFLIKTEG